MRMALGVLLLLTGCDRTIDWSFRPPNPPMEPGYSVPADQRDNRVCVTDCAGRYNQCVTSEQLAAAALRASGADYSRCAYEREACRADCGG